MSDFACVIIQSKYCVTRLYELIKIQLSEPYKFVRKNILMYIDLFEIYIVNKASGVVIKPGFNLAL